MSFGFTAIGTKDEITRQIGATDLTHAGIGRDLGELISGHVAAEQPHHDPAREWRYVVKAHGHSGGGSPLSLTVSIEAQPVAVTRADAPGESAGSIVD